MGELDDVGGAAARQHLKGFPHFEGVARGTAEGAAVALQRRRR